MKKERKLGLYEIQILAQYKVELSTNGSCPRANRPTWEVVGVYHLRGQTEVVGVARERPPVLIPGH